MFIGCRCCGSSLFLKSRYGVGYHIVLVREEHCKIDSVVAMIQSHVPEAKVESTSGAELSLILPKESTASFPALFNDLQASYLLSSLHAVLPILCGQCTVSCIC